MRDKYEVIKRKEIINGDYFVEVEDPDTKVFFELPLRSWGIASVGDRLVYMPDRDEHFLVVMD